MGRIRFCPCYEGPPVLTDRFCWSEKVVPQDRFYCIHHGLIIIMPHLTPTTNTRKMDDLRLNADVESACDADTGARLEVDVDGVRETAVTRHF